MSDFHRELRSPSDSNDGPVAVLIVVCVLFFFIWTPMICQRRCPIRFRFWRSRRENDDDENEIIRVSLRNLNLLRMGFGDSAVLQQASTPPLWNPVSSMTLEDRREFIQNILVSRKILQVIKKQGPPTDDGGLDEDTLKSMPRKTTLLLADLHDAESTSKHISVEPCPICLNEYNHGEILCWSQNPKCSHCFHRECMEEWLLRHEECPCCRHNYLSLDGGDVEEGSDANVPGEPPIFLHNTPPPGLDEAAEQHSEAYLRGVHLFQLLSRLQTLADNRPNTTIRLEGVGLASGRRGTLEIQPATDRTSFDVGSRGLNIRVVNDSEEGDSADNNLESLVGLNSENTNVPRPPEIGILRAAQSQVDDSLDDHTSIDGTEQDLGHSGSETLEPVRLPDP